MNLPQLITFLEVAKRNHFRRAAEHLKLTQPAVSAQIRSLEDELGTPLFHRPNVTLTAAGKAFLPYARQIVALAEEGKQAARETEELLQGSVTLGTASGVALAILPRLLRYFQGSHPSIRVTVHTLPGDRIARGVREGRLDAGIGYLFHPPDQLQSHILFYDSLALIAPPDHPFARKSYVSPAELDGIPLISLPPEATERKWMDQVLRNQGIEPVVSIELSSVEEIKRTVRQGLGLALIPRLSLDPEVDRTIRTLRVPGLHHQLPVALFFPEGRHLPKALRRLLDDIRGIYPPEPES